MWPSWCCSVAHCWVDPGPVRWTLVPCREGCVDFIHAMEPNGCCDHVTLLMLTSEQSQISMQVWGKIVTYCQWTFGWLSFFFFFFFLCEHVGCVEECVGDRCCFVVGGVLFWYFCFVVSKIFKNYFVVCCCFCLWWWVFLWGFFLGVGGSGFCCCCCCCCCSYLESKVQYATFVK